MPGGESQEGASNDHATKACWRGAIGLAGSGRRAQRRARADATLAHGHLLAEAASRPRHVGGARSPSALPRFPAGGLQIIVHAAGEVVPAFEVLDAVGSGVAEMGHTAAFYWQGKQPAAVFYTTVPFGLTPSEHVAWVDAGGGQPLWDELYAPFGVKPFMGGNTGVCMGGWFRRELASVDDVQGLENPLARARRGSLSPPRRDAADDLAERNSHQHAIGPHRRRRIRRPRLRHRARALSGGDVLLRAGLQQAERHRRMHRLEQGLECARFRAQGHRRSMPARARRALRSPRWSGSTRRRWRR